MEQAEHSSLAAGGAEADVATAGLNEAQSAQLALYQTQQLQLLQQMVRAQAVVGLVWLATNVLCAHSFRWYEE